VKDTLYQICCHKNGFWPSPDSSGYPTAGLEGWRAKAPGVGAYRRGLARGVIADSRNQLLRKIFFILSDGYTGEDDRLLRRPGVRITLFPYFVRIFSL